MQRRCAGDIDDMDVGLLLEQQPDDDETINAAFRAAHTIKGSAAGVGFLDVAEFTHHLEDTLDGVRRKERRLTTEQLSTLLEGVDLIRFVTPTTDEARLRRIIADASGYLYYVSVAGVTGTKAVPEEEVRAAMARVRAATDLPCTVGFGIRSPEQAEAIARIADGVVVGSAIVSRVAANLDLLKEEGGRDKVVAEVLELVKTLAGSTHAARRGKVEA